MWLQFLFPLLGKDPTQGEAEFKKLQSSVDPIIRNIREYSNSNEGYQKVLNDMDICIELIVAEPFIDDSNFTKKDKDEVIAHTFYVKSTGMFDFLTLQMGRTLHEQLRGISFAEANRLIRSGELAYAYGELQELIIDTIPINKYPAWAIELYPNIRFIFVWRIASMFPINIVNTDIIAKDIPISGQFNVLFQVVFELSLIHI